MVHLIVKHPVTRAVLSKKPLVGKPPAGAINIGGDYILFRFAGAVGTPAKIAKSSGGHRGRPKGSKNKPKTAESAPTAPKAAKAPKAPKAAKAAKAPKAASVSGKAPVFIILRDSETGAEISREPKPRGRPNRLWVTEGTNLALFMKDNGKVDPAAVNPAALAVSAAEAELQAEALKAVAEKEAVEEKEAADKAAADKEAADKAAAEAAAAAPAEITVAEASEAVATGATKEAEAAVAEPAVAPKPARAPKVEDISRGVGGKQPCLFAQIKDACQGTKEERDGTAVVLHNIMVIGRTGWDNLQFNGVYAKVVLHQEENWIKVWEIDEKQPEPDAVIINCFSDSK
jgi:hypothetical protein